MKRMVCLFALSLLSIYAFSQNNVDRKIEKTAEQVILEQQTQWLDYMQAGLKDAKGKFSEWESLIKKSEPKEQFILKNDSLVFVSYGLQKGQNLADVYKALTKKEKNQTYISKSFSYKLLPLTGRQYTIRTKKGNIDSSKCIIPVIVHMETKIGDAKESVRYEVCFEWLVTFSKKHYNSSSVKSITAKEIRSQAKETVPAEQPAEGGAPVTAAPVADSVGEPLEEISKFEPTPKPEAPMATGKNEDLRIIRTNETYSLLSDYIATMSEYMLRPKAVAGKIIDMFDNANSVVEVSNCNRASISQREANQYFTQLKPGKINIDVKGQDFNDDFTEIIYTIGQAYDNEHYCDFTEKQVHIRYSFAKQRFVIERITVAPGHTQKCE